MARHHSYPFRLICAIVAFVFGASLIVPPQTALAQTPVQTVLNLPLPGQMIQTTNVYQPPILRGVTINPDNPLQFDFLIDTGEDNIDGEDLNRESTKLIKYFLATLTVPEANMWVNLSPFEKDRIIPGDFGLTEMGRDLLAQDYLLKQLTASLMYPEEELGKEFWDRVYKRAQSEFGSTEIPVNTFNKVWIVPAKAEIYVHDQTVYVVNSRLKVMLEEDYLALEHHSAEKPGDKNDYSGLSAQIVRDVLIPEIEREVNEGKLFANLRQIYASMILATWYKKNLKESFLGDVYMNKAKTQGIETEDKEINQKIYQQYLQAFKEGVYNYVKEEYDPALDEVVPRKYFSGGVDQTKLLNELQELPGSEVQAQLPTAGRIVSVNTGLRGEGNAGARDVSYSSVEPTSDSARLTLYQPYRFGDSTTLLEGIRYQTPVQTEEGQKPGVLLYEVTPAVIQAFRAAFAGLTARPNHVESLTALKPLIAAMNQYPLRYKFSRERQAQFKLLEDQLKVIPTDGNRRRAIIEQFSSLLNSLSDDEVREILNSALGQFSQSLSYDARGFQNWEDITIRLMLNADAPFQMDQLEPGSAVAAELKVDLMTLLRGLTNKNFKLYWGMMRQRLIIDNVVRQRVQADDLPVFLKENPGLLKEVLAILVTADTNYDLNHGTRATKFNGLDRSPEGKERLARYRNNIYEELAQDRGGRQYVSLFKRLPKFTRAVNTETGQPRYETDVPARIRAVFDFIAENPELRNKFDAQGILDEASVTELGSLAQKIQSQQYDPIALSDRKPAATTAPTTTAAPLTTNRTTTPVYPTQKDTVTVRAQELLKERTSTAKEYTVSEEVSAYTQPDKPMTATGPAAARSKPKEVRPEDKEENIIYIPLGVTSVQYVEQIKPAIEAMKESRDTGVRTMIFLSHVWPQFLMANANEAGSEELRNLLKTAAGLLDPTVFDIFTRLADFSRDVKKNELLIRDIERELRNNSFLREQGVYVHLEVLTRWQNRPSGKKDQVSILSAVSYKIDEVEFDTEGQIDTSTEAPSILYLGDRIDRIDEDIRALGFTWIGDTFGVVLKDAIKNGAYSGTLPHLFDKPFTTYGQAQAHPLNQLIRTAIQRDYPGFPGEAAIADILNSRYRSTGIHERQHTRDELKGVQKHFSGVGMRVAQETTAYLSSIAYGDAPFTDFVDVIRLHLNLRDGFGALSDLLQIYTKASRNILELFANRLGIENFDLTNNMLDSNAALLERVLAMNAGELQALARSILDEVTAKQSRGENYTAPKKIDVIESAEVLRITEGKTVAVTREVIRPVIDILGVLLTKKPKTEVSELSSKKKIYVTAAGLVIAVISLSMYGSYVFFSKNDDEAQGINVEQPLEIKRVVNPPDLLRDALNLNDADADRYIIRMEDYPRIREYLREIFNYDARPQDHILAVRDATAVETKAGSTLSGISKMFFDDFFNYPAIHSANQAQYGLNPLPDDRSWDAMRGGYNLPRGIALVVPEGIEVEYEVQSGDSLTTIAQRFYGRTISGAQNPLIAWDGVKERWIWERIAEHNGLSLPYAIRDGQRLIIPTNKVEYGVNVLFNNARTLEGDFSKTTVRPTSDKAVLPQRVGGIDLNPNNMQLNDTPGNEIRMNVPVNSQELYNIPVEGFVPVIINITPVSNLPLLLGIFENANDDSFAAQDVPYTPAVTNERLSYLPR